jgi:hypothetical protein
MKREEKLTIDAFSFSTLLWWREFKGEAIYKSGISFALCS